MNEALQRMLEAHVQHELARWQGDALSGTVSELVGGLFRWFAKVKLDEVVKREQILAVIERYVIELRVSGGITELTGEMSRLVFGSGATADTRVDEIVAPASYKEFADKLIELEAVRRELIALMAHSATFAGINARMVARSLLDMLAPSLPFEPGRLSDLAELLGKKLAPPLERRVTELLGSYLLAHRESVTQAIEKHLLSVLDADRLRSLLDEVWEAVAPMRLSEAFSLLGEQDIEDFVVLVHEFWLRYRKSEFFRRISSELTDYFFRKYGQETLSSVIDDMGVTEQMVGEELLGFLRPMLDHAAQSGALAQVLRANLVGFYRSPAALAALGETNPSS